MGEKLAFKVAVASEEPLLRLKHWCRVNRVPLGRLLNAFVQAAADLEPYYVLKESGMVLILPLPHQTNLEDTIRYRYRKQKKKQYAIR
jgi:hypothetical protein